MAILRWGFPSSQGPQTVTIFFFIALQLLCLDCVFRQRPLLNFNKIPERRSEEKCHQWHRALFWQFLFNILAHTEYCVGVRIK